MTPFKIVPGSVSIIVLLAASLLIPSAVGVHAQPLLDAGSHPKFENPLPIPGVMPPVNPGQRNIYYEITMTQFEQWLGLVDESGNHLVTTVWGYNGTYPGATIEARKNQRIFVLWSNDLVDEYGDPLPHLLPVDVSVHWSDPLDQGYPSVFEGPVPVVAHLHGGHTESASDGIPEAWFTPGFAITGPDFVKPVYRYDNNQEAATLWYHDHALGITRLNVYAGLAGFYLLRDSWEDQLNLPGPAPRLGDQPGTEYYEIPLVIQDRMFTADGQLYYPSEPEVFGAPDPSVLPEFFGDFILVNGAAWPVLEVHPRKYRLRLLNGSDSRFYNLFFDEPLAFHQIGTDDGLLYSPVSLDSLVIGPGERADVVLDFSSFAGEQLYLKNNAATPYPGGDPVLPDDPAAGIMLFDVDDEPVEDPSDLPAVLRPEPVVPLHQRGATRELVLFEAEDEFGRLKPMLGTVEEGALEWSAPITENPMMNDVEVWEVYNGTEDAHPIHLHLVSFQIINRQEFTADQDPETGALSNIQLVGEPEEPQDNEKGWKDTAQMFPGEVTRIIAMFDRRGLYVWHCHILSHEDHEMMRPFFVGVIPPSMKPGPAGGDDNIAEAKSPAVAIAVGNYPNPFNSSTEIRYTLTGPSHVRIDIFNLNGQLINTLQNESRPAGNHSLIWDTSSLSSGVYFYRLTTESQSIARKITLLK